MQAKARVSQTNLTITVAAEVLRKARIRALQDDTSVQWRSAPRRRGPPGPRPGPLAATRQAVCQRWFPV